MLSLYCFSRDITDVLVQYMRCINNAKLIAAILQITSSKMKNFTF